MRNDIIDDLIKGSIDFHVHVDPDPYHERSIDALALSHKAQALEMKAIVLKSHHTNTAPLAYLVNQLNDDFLAVGSIVLNGAVGGIDPEVVEVAIATGVKVIWMPTYSSVPDAKRRRESSTLIHAPEYSKDNIISILDNHHELIPPIHSILKIVKANNIVLCTGHLSIAEIYALVKEAQKIGVTIIVTHPLTPTVGEPLSLKQQLELVELGAYIEHCFSACLPFLGNLDPRSLVESIKTIGAEKTILSTDLGLSFAPMLPEGFYYMLASMLKLGVSQEELEWMVKRNPAKLLDM